MKPSRWIPGLFAAAFIAAPSAASAQGKLVVAMPTTPPNVVHMPIHIARELGLFKKYGLTVDIVALEGGVRTYRAMVAGNADVASAPGPFSIVGLSKGAPTKLILANMPTLSASMVVRDNVKTMADLKGKRIGIQQPGGFADILSRGVLRAAKIDPKEVNFVSIATEDVPALVANQVDTAILHPEQEFIAQKKVPTLHAIARMWEVQPDNLYNVFAVTNKTIADKGPALQALVKGHIEATRMMYTARDKVIPIIVKVTGLPKDVAEQALDLLVKNCIYDGNHGLGPKKVNATAALMERVGNIEKGKKPSYEAIVDLSFAKTAIKDLGAWKGPQCPTEAF